MWKRVAVLGLLAPLTLGNLSRPVEAAGLGGLAALVVMGGLSSALDGGWPRGGGYRAPYYPRHYGGFYRAPYYPRYSGAFYGGYSGCDGYGNYGGYAGYGGYGGHGGYGNYGGYDGYGYDGYGW